MEIFLFITGVFLTTLMIFVIGFLFFTVDEEILDGHFKRKVRRWFGVEE